MRLNHLLTSAIAAGVVIAPVAAIGGTRAQADAMPSASTTYTDDVMRLCAGIAATNSGVQDDACQQDPSTHMADDVERLCNKISLNGLDIQDVACQDEPGAYMSEAAGTGTRAGGLQGASLIVPAAAAVGIAIAIAVSDDDDDDVSRGIN